MRINSINNILYRQPLYNWTDEEDHLSILVVGSSEEAAELVDLCLQAGQMVDRELDVHWCIACEQDRTEYLRERPALADFVSLDDAVIDEPYAHLFFHGIEEYLDAFTDRCRYVLAATNDGEHNKEIAELFKGASSVDCLAAYVREGHTEIVGDGDELGVATISEADIERMAFNTHRVWEGEGNLDYGRMKERFHGSRYMHDSSVSFVLSIPYKLKSIGIDSDDLNAAAERMHIISKEELQLVAALEHRRWVMEKVTAGAVRLTNKSGKPEYLSCIARSAIAKYDKNGRLLMHPCIVRSNADTPLENMDGCIDKELWDVKEINSLGLDELDTMSVMLHRTMKRKADAIRESADELYKYINALRDCCTREGGFIKRDFDRYYFCIRNILDRSVPYSAQFETYEKMLLATMGRVQADSIGFASEMIAEIRKILFPVLESNAYRDYKKYDTEMVSQIPFILTNQNDVHICMSLGEVSSRTNNNEDAFRCVASATTLYADKLTYLFVIDPFINYDVFDSKLRGIRNYFRYRGKEIEISVEIFCDADYYQQHQNKLCGVLGQATEEKSIDSYDVHEYSGTDHLISCLTDSLRKATPDFFDGSNTIVRSSLINGLLIEKIASAIPYFEYESLNSSFNNCINCDYLKYMKITSFIQVEDMFALMNAQDVEFNYKDYADDYLDYWDVYSGKAIGVDDLYLCATCWNKVCSVLSDGGISNLTITGKMITGNSGERKTVIKMLYALQKKGLLRNVSINGRNEVSAQITSRKAKEMFSKQGDLLEIYVYYEACKMDWFDDVQTGYKFKWEYDNVINELDCLLTKGSRSILVECKSKLAKNTNDQSVYAILDSLGSHFGINHRKVLVWVADPAKKGFKTYESRGKQLGIITISTRRELENIGARLKEIMMR